MEQDIGAVRDLLVIGPFFRAVAAAAAAGNENHGGRAKGGKIHRIMSGAGRQGSCRQVKLFGCIGKKLF